MMMVMIYIYVCVCVCVYCHLLGDSFVVLQLFSVARHVRRAHVTANNSSNNNNVLFFYVTDLEIVKYRNN